MSEFKIGAGTTEDQLQQFIAYQFAQGSTGIASTGVLAGLSVTQTTTASASVLVNLGAALVQSSVTAGVDPLLNNSQKTLDVLTANPMGATPRNDLVVFDAATTDNVTLTGGIRLIVGTPNAIPTDPTVPITAVPLARLRHAASATTVPTAKIDDLRTFTSLAPPVDVDSGWLTPSTAGFSGTIVDTVKYRKLNGVVYLQGNVQNFTAGSAQNLFTLPSGYRPAVYSGFGTSSNTTTAMYVAVNTSGLVTVWCSSSTLAWTGLATVSFPVG